MTLSTSDVARLLLQRLVSLAGEPRDLCFLAGADELRGRIAFGAMRLLRATVLRRCAFAGSPPALERRRIAARRLRIRHLLLA